MMLIDSISNVLFATSIQLLYLTYAQISTNFSTCQNPYSKIESTIQVITGGFKYTLNS